MAQARATRAREVVLRIRSRALREIARWALPVHRRRDLQRIGSPYGGWVVPTDLVTRGSVVYCGGVGEDITFDLGLIDRVGCEVWAFDPTPRAARHVEATAAQEPRFHFEPIGLWSDNTTLRFFAPSDPAHVSYSAVNLQGTRDYFEAGVRRLPDLMRERGHDHIDLLKIDIEGAEYAVLGDLLDSRSLPTVLCVEFDQPAPALRTARMLARLHAAGYAIASIEGWNYTFVRKDAG